jgi:hypothetical protein
MRLIVPLALRSPRLSWTWAIPLVMWVTLGTGLYVKAWHTVVVLTASVAALILPGRSRSVTRHASGTTASLLVRDGGEITELGPLSAPHASRS